MMNIGDELLLLCFGVGGLALVFAMYIWIVEVLFGRRDGD